MDRRCCSAGASQKSGEAASRSPVVASSSVWSRSFHVVLSLTVFPFTFFRFPLLPSFDSFWLTEKQFRLEIFYADDRRFKTLGLSLSWHNQKRLNPCLFLFLPRKFLLPPTSGNQGRSHTSDAFRIRIYGWNRTLNPRWPEETYSYFQGRASRSALEGR